MRANNLKPYAMFQFALENNAIHLISYEHVYAPNKAVRPTDYIQ